MTHTIETITSTLLEAGWRKQRDYMASQPNATPFILYRSTDRADLPLCTSNEKPVQLVLHPTRITLNGQQHEGWELELTADAGQGRWVKFKEYGISSAELLDILPTAIEGLEAAWKVRATP